MIEEPVADHCLRQSANIATMTSYIPLLTLPERLLANPALAVLFPIAIGTGLGFSISRTYMLWNQLPRHAH